MPGPGDMLLPALRPPLHEVVERGDRMGVRLILMDDPGAAQLLDHAGNTALHLAARHPDRVDIVSALLRAAPSTTHCLNAYGDLPLHVAVRRGNVGAVNELLTVGPSAAAVPNDRGNTAAHLAASLAYPDILKLAADAAPATLAAKNKEGLTPLHLACGAYCDFSAETASRTPLDAETHELPRIILFLLQHTPVKMHEITEVLQLQMPVLHAAAYLGHVELARTILSHDLGALSELDADGSCVVHMATWPGSLAILNDVLRQAPFLACSVDNMLRTPLHIAAKDDHAAAAAILLNAVPQVAFMACQHSETALHYAAWFNSREVARVLVDAAPQTMWMADEDGRLPVWVAAYAGSTEVLELLMDAAPESVAAPDSTGRTALHAAVESMHAHVVDTLVSRAPDLARARDVGGLTPMHVLVARAPSAATDDGPMSPRIDDQTVAAIARVLLRAAPETSYQAGPYNRFLPILKAACWGLEHTVRAILEAAPEAALVCGRGGATVFQMALMCRQYRIVRMLARVPGQDPAALLRALRDHHNTRHGQAFVHEVLTAHPSLPPECWDLVPAGCPGLLLAFSAIATAGRPGDLAKLVARMSDADVRRLAIVVRALQDTGMCTDLVLRVAVRTFA